MGAADIGFGDFISTTIRNEIGERILDVRGTVDDLPEGDSNFVQKWIDKNVPFLSGITKTVFRLGNRLIGFLGKISAKIASVSLTEAWGLFQQTKEFVMNFNINSTDEELDQTVKNGLISLSSQFGEFVGCGLGQVVCGGAMSAIIWKIDKGAAMKAIKAATNEAIDELGDQLGDLMRESAWQVLRWSMIAGFKSGRKFIKWANKNPKVKKYLPEGLSKAIDNWGEEGSKPWSYSQALENKIDSIENDHLRAFTEEFVEGFDECCAEIGYVIAGSFDSARAEAQDMREAVQGVERYVELVPNRDVPNERIVMGGRDAHLRTALTTTMATYEMLNNRDVGQIVAAPVVSAVEPRSKGEPKIVTLTIQFAPVRQPPFTKRFAPEGTHWRVPTYSIPFVDPDKLDYEKIRRACGNDAGIRWGKYEAYGWLGGRKMAVRGASENEAIAHLEELAELSSKPLLSIGVRHTTKRGERGRYLTANDDPMRVFCAYATVLINSRVLDRDKESGRASLAGNYEQRKERIEIWIDKPLPGVKALLQQLKAEAKAAEIKEATQV
ncbi:MAG: hypothetical protein SAJ12_10530 [Jaaginema sp. PMC 1079.18]|nr:hypothetical protein [Jaaginema sp. PMC 1080.18]MEC4851437.1 hypothetical protein [Jaaginema sp. PMC 1079.18]MEC4866093.1 hypothetical protein [Jaaginema sp. PMC 1078.18]